MLPCCNLQKSKFCKEWLTVGQNNFENKIHTIHVRSKLIPMQCDVVFTIVTTSTFMFSTPMWFVMEEEIALGFFIRILK